MTAASEEFSDVSPISISSTHTVIYIQIPQLHRSPLTALLSVLFPLHQLCINGIPSVIPPVSWSPCIATSYIVTRLRPVPELGEIRERLNLAEMRHASASRGLDSLSIQANDTDDRLHRLVMERLERKGDATATLVADMRAEPADHTAQITQILQAIKGGR